MTTWPVRKFACVLLVVLAVGPLYSQTAPVAPTPSPNPTAPRSPTNGWVPLLVGTGLFTGIAGIAVTIDSVAKKPISDDTFLATYAVGLGLSIGGGVLMLLG